MPERFFLPEITPPTTPFHLVSEEHNIDVWIDVPFSSEELGCIQQAYTIQHEQSLRNAMANGSGPERTLIAHFPIPYGYSLRNRNDAFQRIRKTGAFIDTSLKGDGFLNKETRSAFERLRVEISPFIPQFREG